MFNKTPVEMFITSLLSQDVNFHLNTKNHTGTSSEDRKKKPFIRTKTKTQKDKENPERKTHFRKQTS